MYRDELQDDEDLRVEIFHLKKQLSNVSAENHLLKVKIRKLQNEIVKKDKQMDVVLDPRKVQFHESIDVRKILYERSASFVLNMKEKNEELLYLLREKDVIIRRLQNQLSVTKLYSQPPKKQYNCKCPDHVELHDKINQIQMKMTCSKHSKFCNVPLEEDGNKKNGKSRSWTSGLQEAESTLIEEEELEENDDSSKSKVHNMYDVKEQYKNLSRDHLLSIIENLKNNQRYSPSFHRNSSRKSSPESDLERIELLCESPHEEIQQLHSHFLDMISEVDHLKCTIAQLQNNQEKTESVLKKKNTNIDKLAQEIKNLKRPKPRPKSNRNRNIKSYSSSDLVARVYSGNNDSGSGKICTRYERGKHIKSKESTPKEKKSDRSTTNSESRFSMKKRKEKLKDAIVQVEKLDSPESPLQCLYIEKGSVTITQKANGSDEKIEKDYEYDDEVFEECDGESTTAN